MHYILRTARCLHAWRSDTVAALNQRRDEKHAAELKLLEEFRAQDKKLLLETNDLQEQIKEKDVSLRDKEDQIEALVWESRRWNTEISRLQKENEDLQLVIQTHDQELQRQASESDTQEELVAKIVLLQELQKRTEDDNNRDIASHRQQMETYKAEVDLLRAQLHEKEAASQKAHEERGSIIDEMHTKLEQQLKHEIQLMNASMAALEEKYKAQEEELATLRRSAATAVKRKAQDDEEMHQALTRQVQELQVSLDHVEWERAKQQEELVLTRGTARRLEDASEGLALKTHELIVAQVRSG